MLEIDWQVNRTEEAREMGRGTTEKMDTVEECLGHKERMNSKICGIHQRLVNNGEWMKNAEAREVSGKVREIMKEVSWKEEIDFLKRVEEKEGPLQRDSGGVGMRINRIGSTKVETEDKKELDESVAYDELNNGFESGSGSYYCMYINTYKEKHDNSLLPVAYNSPNATTTTPIIYHSKIPNISTRNSPILRVKSPASPVHNSISSSSYMSGKIYWLTFLLFNDLK